MGTDYTLARRESPRPGPSGARPGAPRRGVASPGLIPHTRTVRVPRAALRSLVLVGAIGAVLLVPTGDAFAQSTARSARPDDEPARTATLPAGPTVAPLRSDAYRLLDLLYLEAGLAPPSRSRPYSLDEFGLYLSRLDVGRFSQAGRAAYDRLVRTVAAVPRYRDEGLEVFADLDAAVEAYLHTNAEVIDWERGYAERAPAVRLTLGLEAFGVLSAGGDLDLREEHAYVNDTGNTTNLPESMSTIDYHFPFRAAVALGGPHWSVQFGRDTLVWGAGHTGTLLVSDAPDFHDFLRYTLFWRHFKYSGAVIALDPVMTDAEREREESRSYVTVGPLEDHAKTLFLHRFEVDIAGRVRVALTEGLMYGLKYPDLRYFNPLQILHNFFAWENASSLLGLDLIVSPWRFVTVYGQVAFNQIQTAFEGDRYGSAADIANAMGYLAGVEFAAPVARGYLVGGAEFVHTDPWMYIREHPLTSFHWRRRVTSNYLGRRTIVTAPIGYWAGPDARVASATLGYVDFGSTPVGPFEVSLEYRHLWDGAHTVETPYDQSPEAVALRTPTSPAEVRRTVRLAAAVEPWPAVRIGADFYFVVADNHRNVEGTRFTDFQAALSASFATGRFEW